jgi:hypothetical protein
MRKKCAIEISQWRRRFQMISPLEAPKPNDANISTYGICSFSISISHSERRDWMKKPMADCDDGA